MKENKPLVTTEPIVDPYEFAKENIGVGDMNRKGWRIVVGPDYHILATQQELSGSNYNRRGGVSPWLLGYGLYQNGWGKYALDDSSIGLSWYQSPDVINQISRDIGLEPGKTVLRATTSDYMGNGGMSRRRYIKHFAAGEYPVSVNSQKYFEHDRTDDHITAMMFLPPSVTRAVIDRAKKDVRRPILTTEHKKYDRLTGRASAVLSSYPHLSEALTGSPSEEAINKLANRANAAADKMLSGFIPSELNSHLNPNRVTITNKHEIPYYRLIHSIVERYIELRPKLEVLGSEPDSKA